MRSRYGAVVNLECLAAARAALARGDVLIAYDEATAAAALDPDDLDAQYVAVLALARSGAAHRAAEAAERLRGRLDDTQGISVRLREDVEALGARLAKDFALSAPADGRRALLLGAADRYEAIADRYRRHYPCVNAATLRLLAGDLARARELAARARLLASTDDADDSEGSEGRYWRLATVAEASLVLDEPEPARTALEQAVASGADLAALAATRRQLALVCAATDASCDVLDVLHLPGVIHYCGHVAGLAGGAGRFPSREGERIAQEIARFLADREVGIAYGSLASGADIVVAEAVLARGSELHVVLPFDTREFEEISVRPGGERWVERCRAVLARASSVAQACDSAYLGDDSLFAYGSLIAMGHAINRAAVIGVEPEQLAVWDGLPARGPGGTADAIDVWRRAGAPTHVVAVSPVDSGRGPAGAAPAHDSHRSVRAMLFTDLRGFSRLRDEQFPMIIDELFTPLAAALDRFGDAVLWRNSWGDAVVAVFDDVVTAARAALALQEAAGAVDLERAGLPSDLALRIAAHVGPVLALRDPFCDREGWWGRQLTRAARIEPRTPEGEVYATDAFAALLALEPDSGLACEYVGRVTTAKDFETIPMYRVRRRETPGVAAPAALA